MVSSPLKGTRYLVKKRALFIVILTLLASSLFAISFQLRRAGSSPLQGRMDQYVLMTAPAVVDSPVFSGDQDFPSNQSALFKIERSMLLELVNRTDVVFVQSSGDVPYYVVVSAGPRGRLQVLGLVYLTTDVALDWTWGFNSHLQVLVFVDQTGTIRSLRVFDMQESWGYLITDYWVNGFVNRTVYEPLQVGGDVDGITRATYTCKAIASGVREAGRIVVDDYRTREIIIIETTVNSSTIAESARTSTSQTSTQSLILTTRMIQLDDLTEAAVITGMFVLAILAFNRNDGRLKYVVLGGAVISIGIYTGRMISVVDLTALVSLSLPPLLSNLYWYSLYGWTVMTSFMWGRLYCGYLCPFGAFTQIMNRISPIKARIPTKVHSKLVYVKYPVLVMVVIGVLSGNSWIIGVEPFQTFFFLKGDWWMWVIMIAAVILSVPFNRLYCHYVCPIGALLSLVGRARVMEIRRWPECDRCKLCEQTCPEGAIVGPKISVLECMNCRECEKNYLDPKMCPHYSPERLNS